MTEYRFRWFARTFAVAVVCLLSMGIDHCPPQIAHVLVARYAHLIEDELGFALYVEPGSFDPGTRFAPDVPGLSSGPFARVWTCANRCRLMMLDLDPTAHFSHSVVLATYDLETGQIHADTAEWWPFDIDSGVRYFNTEKARRTRSVLCSDDDCAALFPIPAQRLRWTQQPTFQPVFSGPPPTPPESKVWAVILNGYDDPEDTFDVDTDGMYQVLRAFGVPDWRICYLSDRDSVLGADVVDSDAQKTILDDTIAYITALLDNNLTPALQQAGIDHCGAQQPNTTTACDEFVFFISTHGAGGVLRFNDHKEFGGKITSSKLYQWIDNIECDHKTIVIEACKSGSFLPVLQGDTHSVFVSANPSKSSYKDRDPYCAPGDTSCDPTDPQQHDPNPGDAGSEVVWGFLEAFGTAEADIADNNGIKDTRISFAEAVEYAINNDASPSSPSSAPGLTVPWFAFYDDYVPQPTTVKIVGDPSTQSTVVTEEGLGIAAVTACANNTITVLITNSGPQYIGAQTLRMYSSGPSSTTVVPADHAQTMIIPGLIPNASAKFELSWFAGGSLGDGTQLVFNFNLDAPQSPAVAHVGDQTRALPVVVDAPSSGGMAVGCRTTACAP